MGSHAVVHEHHWCLSVAVGPTAIKPQYRKCCVCGADRYDPHEWPPRSGAQEATDV
jgi:hypothetical protein